jgi:hypothetical protein
MSQCYVSRTVSTSDSYTTCHLALSPVSCRVASRLVQSCPAAPLLLSLRCVNDIRFITFAVVWYLARWRLPAGRGLVKYISHLQAFQVKCIFGIFHCNSRALCRTTPTVPNNKYPSGGRQRSWSECPQEPWSRGFLSYFRSILTGSKMTICTECSIDFPGMVGEPPCKKCSQLEACSSDIEKSVIAVSPFFRFWSAVP